MNPITQITDYFYDNLEHLQATRVQSKDSKGNTMLTKTYFSGDVSVQGILGDGGPLSNTEYLAIRRLQSPVSTNPLGQNRISEPIQVETTINGKKNIRRTAYKISNDLVFPEFVKSLKGEYDETLNPMEDRVVYHQYDSFGNPQVVSKESGSSVTYIWGYNKQYPIAKLENIEYADIPLGLISTAETDSDQDNDRTIGNLGKEGDLRASLNALRTNLPSAMVSTYTYDPLIGVTSMTDPRGYTIYYEYDDFNRLEAVRDTDGNLISDYKYAYKQTVSN